MGFPPVQTAVCVLGTTLESIDMTLSDQVSAYVSTNFPSISPDQLALGGHFSYLGSDVIGVYMVGRIGRM